MTSPAEAVIVEGGAYPHRVMIETPLEWGWGDRQAAKYDLGRGGYHVEELRGTGPVRLWLFGSRQDPAHLVVPS